LLNRLYNQYSNSLFYKKELPMFIYLFTLLIFFNTSTYITFQDVQQINKKNFKLVYIQQGDSLEEQYFIDDKSVDQNAFWQAKIQAMSSESAQAYQNCLQKKAEHDLKCADLNQKCLLKILHQVLLQVNPIMQQICNPVLERFYVFSPDTIKDRSSLQEIKKLLSDLADIADSKANFSLPKANLIKLVDNLPVFTAKLSQFFQQSKNNAISNCHDTKALKELLEI
jgi:hypothetical protein